MDDVLPPLTHAPDGLYESDIDALIDEYFTAGAPQATSQHTRLSSQTVSAALRGRAVETNRVDGEAA